MIGTGHPEEPRNAKELCKNGAVLFFATDSNLLFAREGDGWIVLGHVLPLDAPTMNQPIPRIAGVPHGGVRLIGTNH